MASRLRIASALALVLSAAGSCPARSEAPRVAGAVLEPVDPRTLPGFAEDDLAAGLDAFRASCATLPEAAPDLGAACARASDFGPGEAVAFLTAAFDAYRVVRSEGRTGFLTGYFEPELEGSLEPVPGYATPVLARPDDLVTLDPGETRPGLDPRLRAARRMPGGYEPYPDRTAIEEAAAAGAEGGRYRPVLYLRDAVDLFVLQVQGSGRVRLRDGRSLRVLYDGKNGRPYTSVGKLIVQEGHLPLEGLTLARWTGWLRANPEAARRLMRANASYVFFRLEAVADPRLGPPGAAGVPLTPGRSLAVDATLWRYGLPFWLEGRLPGPGGSRGRLVVAQDTGSAIVGPARGDLYVGTGVQAGAAAGDLRDAVGFVVFLPRPVTAEAAATGRQKP